MRASSPAQVAATGNPKLLYFYPFELCQIRYCRQPADVAATLFEKCGHAVDLVPVMVYSGASGGASLANWDIYLVPPYDGWVPDLSETVYGFGLPVSVVVLVDG